MLNCQSREKLISMEYLELDNLSFSLVAPWSRTQVFSEAEYLSIMVEGAMDGISIIPIMASRLLSLLPNQPWGFLG